MMPTNNPTALSAVVGDALTLSGRGRRAALIRGLVMPVVVAAFATYLLVGMLTMEVPAGTAFPGPQFFPGIIAAGLYLFAVLLVVATLREARAAAEAEARALEELLEAPDPTAVAATTDVEDASVARAVRVDWRSMAWVAGSVLAFSLLLNVLGWVIGAALLFWGVARGFGGGRPLVTLLVGLTVSSLTYIAFDMALGMSLPSGVLGWEF